MVKCIKRLLKLIITFIVCILAITLAFAVMGVSDCSRAVTSIVPDVSKVTTSTIIKENQDKISGYHRPISSTYMIFPEWYIVYSSREYANFLKTNEPSGFPYFSSIKQYWCSYYTVYQLGKNYPLNADDHLMLVVIGVSFSAEYIVKGVYENTIGRVTEWLSSGEPVSEDKYAQKVAQEYVDFIPLRPWFEFPFSKSLAGLWSETSWSGPHMIRKWERKIILSMEYSFKAFYGWLMGLGSHAAMGVASDYVYATIQLPSDQVLANSNMKNISHIQNDQYIIAIPHEQPFTDSVNLLSRSNTSFIDIAGNREILLSFMAPKNWQYDLDAGKVVFTMDILTDPSLQRVVLQVPVGTLLDVVKQLNVNGIEIEHVYDY